MSASTAPVRTRTFSWDDPPIGARAAPTISGLEYLQIMGRGELPAPSIMLLLNIGFQSVEEGRVVFSVEPAEYHCSPIGTVHGGLASTLCAAAISCVLQSTLPVGVDYTRLELKINVVRPLTVATGLVRCAGNVINVGGRVAAAEARVTDRAGKLYAHATSTSLIMRPPTATERAQ